MIYLTLAGLERFGNDFLRADREVIYHYPWHHLSIHQLIALTLAILAGITFIIICFRTPKKDSIL